MLRFFRLIALLIAFQLVGGHWAVFQTAAWISMTVEYAKSDTLENAFVKAIEGHDPCKMCVAIKKGRADEEKQSGLKQVLKAEAVLSPSLCVFEPTPLEYAYPPAVFLYRNRTELPATPPPLA